MAAKFVIILSMAVAASAVPLVPIGKAAYAEHEAPAHYEYQYSVHDSHTGDIKEQKEARNGDAVQGSYSLVQPDGLLRVVDYTADKVNGFNAVVRYEGHPTPAPAKVLAPVAKVAYQAAPVYHSAPVYQSAPVYHAAPVAKVAYQAAPVYHSAPVYHAAPVAKVAYQAAPVYHAAPVAKVAYQAAPVYHAAPAAKVAYTAPLGHVTFSSPAISYHH